MLSSELDVLVFGPKQELLSYGGIDEDVIQSEIIAKLEQDYHALNSKLDNFVSHHDSAQSAVDSMTAPPQVGIRSLDKPKGEHGVDYNVCKTLGFDLDNKESDRTERRAALMKIFDICGDSLWSEDPKNKESAINACVAKVEEKHAIMKRCKASWGVRELMKMYKRGVASEAKNQQRGYKRPRRAENVDG
ncbi:hypothetical protein OIO90_004721 [Microbotryomycetes sp. JL221]|nr:hypothetical protein OIO90_004721 [Microbotryomycetes sp. JL221]